LGSGWGNHCRKLAALDPAVVGAGHAEPLGADSLRETLERAAEKY
jgi:hypothetical protein